MGVNMMTVGKTLLTPHKVIKVSRKISVLDEEANKNKDPKVDTMESKMVSKKLPANFQLGTVVATGPKQDQFTVGSVVAFKPARVVNFELIKNTILVDDFDIVCLWEEN